MDPQSIQPGDLGRVLLGEVPPTFLLEVLVRMVVVYAVLVVSMRAMGKRMASQATRNELAAVVSLAAAIGPAVQAPERGLLPVILIAALIVGGQRAIALGSFKSPTFERATQGSAIALVVDGELDLDAMRDVVLARERLFAHLRAQRLDNLGRVQRLYLEAGGRFSIVTFDHVRPGLSLLPAWDEDFVAAQHRATGKVACARCGHVGDEGLAGQASRCGRCGGVDWRLAIES